MLRACSIQAKRWNQSPGSYNENNYNSKLTARLLGKLSGGIQKPTIGQYRKELLKGLYKESMLKENHIQRNKALGK